MPIYGRTSKMPGGVVLTPEYMQDTSMTSKIPEKEISKLEGSKGGGGGKGGTASFL